jgi:GntR family transcriptional regulator, galactonate operon transcriptional repressor
MIKFDSAALRGGTSRKRNLFSHVVEDLGSRIVRGDFKPGSALPNEAVLGQEFEASRSVIREAVKALAAKGMIESRTRTGIRVLSPIHWNLLDPEVLGWRYSAMPPAQFLREIFEIRGLIEPQAAAFSAERASKTDIAEIAAAYAAMEEADQPGSAAINADLRFHRAVLAGAHNHLLLQMGNLIGVGLTVSYGLSSDSFEVFLPRHKDVLDAITAHKPNAAHDAMQRLLGDTRTYLDKQLSRPARKGPRSNSKRATRTAALA